MPVKKNSDSQSVDSTSDYAARIRALIEEDRVVQARALISEALEMNPKDPEIPASPRPLKPPQGKPRPIIDADRSEELEWMVVNRDASRGRWILFEGNRLLANSASFAELQTRIKELTSTPPVRRWPGSWPLWQRPARSGGSELAFRAALLTGATYLHEPQPQGAVVD